MRRLILLLLAMFAVNSSASTDPQYATVRNWTAPTVKVPMTRTKKRQMNIYYFSQANEFNGNVPDTDADDLDIYVGYRRPELAYDAAAPDADTIPDHVLARLKFARQQAVLAHMKVWNSQINM